MVKDKSFKGAEQPSDAKQILYIFKPCWKDKGKFNICDKCTPLHGPGRKPEIAEIKGC